MATSTSIDIMQGLQAASAAIAGKQVDLKMPENATMQQVEGQLDETQKLLNELKKMREMLAKQQAQQANTLRLATTSTGRKIEAPSRIRNRI